MKLRTQIETGNNPKRSHQKELIFIDHYPEENRNDCIESITDALAHIGVFDGITDQNNKKQ